MSEKFLRSLTVGGDKMSFLPSVGTDNNGKVLKVIDGEWAIGTYGEVESVISPWLAFSGNEDFTLKTNNGAANWDGTLEYSIDRKNWTTWDGTEISSNGKNLFMRGTGNSVITGSSTNKRWVFSGNNTLEVNARGNIENLLDYETAISGEHPTMGDYCYHSMFIDCTFLVTPPELPATILATYCYYNMFAGCSSLKVAPRLPATTLALCCYGFMFDSCSGLNVYTVASSDASYDWLCSSDNSNYEVDYMFYNCKLDGATFPNSGTPTEGTTYYWDTGETSGGTVNVKFYCPREYDNFFEGTTIYPVIDKEYTIFSGDSNLCEYSGTVNLATMTHPAVELSEELSNVYPVEGSAFDIVYNLAVTQKGETVAIDNSGQTSDADFIYGLEVPAYYYGNSVVDHLYIKKLSGVSVDTFDTDQETYWCGYRWNLYVTPADVSFNPTNPNADYLVEANLYNIPAQADKNYYMIYEYKEAIES